MKSKPRRPTKLDMLLGQGQWVLGEVEGQKLPYFAMPTAALQIELNEALDKKIKKDLKANGYELLHATRREHPFHSELLRERIDALAPRFDPRTNSEEGLADLRKEYDAMVGDPQLTFQSVPFTQDDADWLLAKHIKDAHAAWASGFENYRDMRKNAWYWRGTKAYNTIFPPDGPPLPDGPPPKPMYVHNERPDLVIQLLGGFVHLYAKVELLNEA